MRVACSLCWRTVEEDTYTTGQAARILRITDRGVRKMIDRGELEARQDERGRHLIPQRAVHAMLEERRAVGEGEVSSVEISRSAEEERELLAQLLEEERAERRRLQEELNTERSKGFWQRLFGP